jgi:hypothetical protein
VITVKTVGIPKIERNLERLYTDADRREDLQKFKERGERRRRKGLGGRNNTVTGALHGDTRMVLTTTLNQPRTKGNAWQREFVYAIYPAMAKRVFRARAKKIEERWRA